MRWTLKTDVTEERIEHWQLSTTKDGYVQMSVFYHDSKECVSFHRVLDLPIDEWEQAFDEIREKMKILQLGS